MKDTIYRQAAIDEIDEWIKAFRENGHKESAADACLIQDGIIQLPSAEPERKTGKWVGVKEFCDHINEKAEREGKGPRFIPSGMNNCVYCNQCWESNDRRTTYCPNCGADMRGGEDDNIVR